MDRIFHKALADIKIEKQMLWAVKVRAKMIWKKKRVPSDALKILRD